MTQQFKFGDFVKRKSDGAVGVVVSISFKSVLVFFDGNAASSFMMLTILKSSHTLTRVALIGC